MDDKTTDRSASVPLEEKIAPDEHDDTSDLGVGELTDEKLKSFLQSNYDDDDEEEGALAVPHSTGRPLVSRSAIEEASDAGEAAARRVVETALSDPSSALCKILMHRIEDVVTAALSASAQETEKWKDRALAAEARAERADQRLLEIQQTMDSLPSESSIERNRETIESYKDELATLTDGLKDTIAFIRDFKADHPTASVSVPEMPLAPDAAAEPEVAGRPVPTAGSIEALFLELESPTTSRKRRLEIERILGY